MYCHIAGAKLRKKQELSLLLPILFIPFEKEDQQHKTSVSPLLLSSFRFHLHSSLITYHFSLLTHHLSLLTHHFSLLTIHSSLLTSHLSLLYSTRMQLVVPIAVSAAVSIDTITCITVFQVSLFIVLNSQIINFKFQTSIFKV